VVPGCRAPRQGAWTFARRPLDLTELVQSWQANGRLGTLAQLHSGNITVKLTDDPNRKDRAVLSEERARNGAERLALALTRSRTIRSPEQALAPDRADGVLDSAAILTDWTPEERQTLLRRPLFDPATHGRVRFHHRALAQAGALWSFLRHRFKQGNQRRSCDAAVSTLAGRYDADPSCPTALPA